MEFFEICNDQNMTVANAATKQWNFSYRRWFNEDFQCQLRRSRDVIMICALSPEKDKPIWYWGTLKISL